MDKSGRHCVNMASHFYTVKNIKRGGYTTTLYVIVYKLTIVEGKSIVTYLI